MNRNNPTKNIIIQITNQFKNDIAWLTVLHLSLKIRQDEIRNYASLILEEPMKYIQLNIPATEKEKIEKMIKELTKEWYGKPPIDNVGHYLNKSAILYVDALLNAFLDKVYEVIAKEKQLTNKELSSKSISGKLNQFEQNIFQSSCSIDKISKHVKFIAQLRHLITHRNGIVDKEFLKKCGIKNNKCNPLWDTNIWPNERSFLNSYKLGSQLSLAIEKVIIPYLRHAVEFIDEFVNQILTII